MRRTERRQEWWDESGELPASRNVLPVMLGLVGIGAVVCAVWALGLQTDRWTSEKLGSCVLIPDDHARLACYDDIAMFHQPAKGAFAPVQIFREGSK